MAPSVLLSIVLTWTCMASLLGRAAGTCCSYCQPDGDNWVNISRPWNLTIAGEFITDFRSPSVYFLDEEMNKWYWIWDGIENVYHAGAPIILEHHDLSDPTAVLETQYVQYDLGSVVDVTSIHIQGGYVRDEEDSLMTDHISWPTLFAVSFSTSTSPDGPYDFVRDGSGNIQVDVGGANERTPIDYELTPSLPTRALRIHPLGGYNEKRENVDQIMMRVGIHTCDTAVCSVSRVQECSMSEWHEWSECVCAWEGCLRTRMRTVYTYPSCGGRPCADPWERETCTIPADETNWTWLICLIILLILILIILLCIYLYRRYYLRKGPQMMFAKKRQTTPEQQLVDENQVNGEQVEPVKANPKDNDRPLSASQVQISELEGDAEAPSEAQLYGPDQDVEAPPQTSDDSAPEPVPNKEDELDELEEELVLDE